ncbi:MAG: nuclear transport factor 2 family protein [Alphaproteobacteria bacterium]|jgi:hypothetical protein|uniref:Nuclear transport factor 2 family protein n=1 Tax=Peteryoungia algae TaxID=2919917 RepID=A0ABT0D1M3_9HYPH|nr:nuclear transport factor 2 family protein [Rhizobium sp. SSM4.3]MBU2326432.1 nuclear transport factor 2 family protein [Alphaproteobacteria bacterium]MCJ8239310.1 nuclear transport factor 2 family protein [Rhizobium sp. SSM4.3]
MDNAQRIAEHYIAVWNETDADERSKLIAETFTDDTTYIDPLMAADGPSELHALVGAVHQRFPGFRFALVGKPDGYGSRLRFSWKLGPADNDDMIKGTDFAVVEDGRLRSVDGFLDRVPATA